MCNKINGKKNSIFIVGDSNAGKTYFLDALNSLFLNRGSRGQRGNTCLLYTSFIFLSHCVLPSPTRSSSQIYVYTLTAVIGDSKAPQNKDNVFVYYWNECEQSKGSN